MIKSRFMCFLWEKLLLDYGIIVLSYYEIKSYRRILEISEITL